MRWPTTRAMMSLGPPGGKRHDQLDRFDWKILGPRCRGQQQQYRGREHPHDRHNALPTEAFQSTRVHEAFAETLRDGSFDEKAGDWCASYASMALGGKFSACGQATLSW
jgi:hypothetical protein